MEVPAVADKELRGHWSITAKLYTQPHEGFNCYCSSGSAAAPLIVSGMVRRR
jgi:hypothetical protein